MDRQMDADDDQWEVEALTGKRKRAGIIHYRVKWSRWEEETWAPSEDIAKELVEEYEEFRTKRARPSAEPFSVKFLREKPAAHIDPELVED